MILLDTTVLVYAVGDEHPLRSPCRRLIEALRDERLRATTTAEVIQEFAHVRSGRRTRPDAADLAEDFVSLLRPLAVVDEDDVRAGLDLFRRHDDLGAFDAMLAATAVRRQVRALVSADPAFVVVDGLTYADPSDPELVDRFTPR